MTETMERPAVRRDVVLVEARIQLAEHLRQDWVVNAEAGSTVEDILRPGYWAHCAQHMTMYDTVQVRLETGEWICDLFVMEVGRNYAKMHLAHKYDLTAGPAVVIPPEAHRIEFKGPQLKHVVIRVADGAVIQDGLSKKEDAILWLRNYEKVTAG